MKRTFMQRLKILFSNEDFILASELPEGIKNVYRHKTKPGKLYYEFRIGSCRYRSHAVYNTVCEALRAMYAHRIEVENYIKAKIAEVRAFREDNKRTNSLRSYGKTAYKKKSWS